MVSREEVNFAQLVNEKSIAVVGNASSLFDQKYGKEIDQHDIVIRFNKTAIFCVDDYKETHGERIDVWAFWAIGAFYRSVTETEEDYENLIKAFYEKKDIKKIQLAMSSHNRDIAEEHVFDTLSKKHIHNLRRNLYYLRANINREVVKKQNRLITEKKIVSKNIQPSAGIGILYWLKMCNTKKIDIYGMDFKKTPTFSEANIYDRDVIERIDIRCSHNFEIEEEFVKRQILIDKRFKLK